MLAETQTFLKGSNMEVPGQLCGAIKSNKLFKPIAQNKK